MTTDILAATNFIDALERPRTTGSECAAAGIEVSAGVIVD